MQPKTNVRFDKQTFDRLKNTIKIISITNKNRLKDYTHTLKIPKEIGFQLTNRCNLRCKHCFQWNEDGLFHKMDKHLLKNEMDIKIIKKVFSQTKSSKSNIYLWGGEPLCYSKWDELCDILANDSRWTVLCTNGILIDQKIDSIIKISKSLAITISLDGFKFENDKIRGDGTFDKVLKNIHLLIDLKNQGIFKGEITINCVISEDMIGKLYDFMEFFEAKKINTVYFCFPWFISEKTANQMDIYYKRNFENLFLSNMNNSVSKSWHSYSYNLSKSVLPKLKKEIRRINSRIWKIRIRFQPAL
jgi:sulfatase maturation enzyme AslB (radical SAM superfamily)